MRNTLKKIRAQLVDKQIVDISIRIILALFFSLSAGTYYGSVIDKWHNLNLTHLDWSNVSHLLSVFSIGIYMLMIASLYVLRLRPINKFAGFWPAATALLGGFLLYGLVWLDPRNDLPPWIEIMACILILIGNIFAVYILTKLGRSFSILPEGRQLVTTGPYKIIRHPLYVAEALTILGTMILFFSPAAVILVIVQTALQLGRIHYEERILCATFPEYKKYARHTARLIPGVY
jgi:protein-S-isoprenylcysteine O-methyltransferase Ste14